MIITNDQDFKTYLHSKPILDEVCLSGDQVNILSNLYYEYRLKVCAAAAQRGTVLAKDKYRNVTLTVFERELIVKSSYDEQYLKGKDSYVDYVSLYDDVLLHKGVSGITEADSIALDKFFHADEEKWFTRECVSVWLTQGKYVLELASN